MSRPTAELIAKYGRPGPRYTSYPAVPYWPRNYSPDSFDQRLREMATEQRRNTTGVSVYVHIPFCAQRCLFCACHTIVTRKVDRGAGYVDLLRRELERTSMLLGGYRPWVRQLHLGGGTPTWLPIRDLEAIYQAIGEHFELSPDREQSIEVDPRVTTLEQLAMLVERGLNRLSLGVQDVEPGVQAAIARHQTLEQTERIVTQARRLGVTGISVDVIYGLPRQTVETFRDTIDAVIRLGIDRVAVYNFAFLPDKVRHQRAIAADDLPTEQVRIELLHNASTKFAEAGYEMVGMDHFARAEDELARARANGTMQRNFMGYSTRVGTDLLGFGVSAISRVGRDFAQNAKDLDEYQRLLESGESPVVAGMSLGAEDLIRESVIQQIMCYDEVDLGAISRIHGLDLLAGPRTSAQIAELEADGLVVMSGDRLCVTTAGRYFLRNIAMVFDTYLSGTSEQGQPRFSSTV